MMTWSHFFKRALVPGIHCRRWIVWGAVFLSGVGGLRAAVNSAILPQPAHGAQQVASQIQLRWSAAGLDLIANGGFESGDLTGWTEDVQAQAGGIRINDGLTDPDGQGPDTITSPVFGNFNADSVPNSPGRFGLYQDVAIPSDATLAVLRWSDRIRNFENNGTFVNAGNNLHTFRVELRNPANNQLLETMFQTEVGDPPLANWTKRNFDLTAYRGQTVRISFVTYVFLFFFSVHLDEVSLGVETSRAATNEVYFGSSGLAFQGRTSINQWSLPQLQPATSYQWRVIRRLDEAISVGPIWTFATGPRGELDHFSWAPISSPQHSGQPIAISMTARDARFNTVTSFDESVGLSARSLTGTPSSRLLNDKPFTAFAAFGRGTVGYAFTPNTDLYVHALRSFSGDEVALWSASGTRLAWGSVTNQLEQWTETPLPNVVHLGKGKSYRITSFTEQTAFQYARFDHDGLFAHGTIDQAYQGTGNGFPEKPHPARWWFVDLAYRTAESGSWSVAPSTIANFQNGQWTGNVAVTGASTSMVLHAEQSNGVGGSSGVFSLEAP